MILKKNQSFLLSIYVRLHLNVLSGIRFEHGFLLKNTEIFSVSNPEYFHTKPNFLIGSIPWTYSRGLFNKPILYKNLSGVLEQKYRQLLKLVKFINFTASCFTMKSNKADQLLFIVKLATDRK